MSKTIIKTRSLSTNLRVDEYYLWIKDILRWQKNNFDINIVLLDLKNLLQFGRSKSVKDFSFNIVKDLSALGVNFNKTNLVFQSQLPEIQEIIVYLQYSELLINKTANNIIPDSINYYKLSLDLFSEIAVMMIFNSDIILTEKSEVKKIELARNLISKFNYTYKKSLKLPQPFISYHPKLIGLDGKEELNNENCLLFSDNKNTVKKKIISATTDSDSQIKFDSKRKPYISNLINLYQFFTNKTYDEIEDEFRGKKYVEFKSAIVKQLNKFLKSHIKKTDIKNENFIKKMLLKSHQKSSYKLRKNLEVIKEAMNIPHL